MVTLQVLDSASGSPLCDATVQVSCGSPPSAFLTATEVDGECAYVFTYGSTATCRFVVTAPGYVPGQTSVAIQTTNSCDGPESATNAKATVQLMPACGSPFSHDDGLGDSWSDCTAANTYNGEEATEACLSATLRTSAPCGPSSCADVDGGRGAGLCASFSAPGQGACTCWSYSGAAAGHVRVSDGGCECPTSSDPSWD